MRLKRIRWRGSGKTEFARLSNGERIIGVWRIYRDKESEGYTPEIYTLWRFLLAKPREWFALHSSTVEEHCKVIEVDGSSLLDLGDSYLARPGLVGRDSPAYHFEQLPHIVELPDVAGFDLKLITSHGMYAYADYPYDQTLSFDLRNRRVEVTSSLRGSASVHLD